MSPFFVSVVIFSMVLVLKSGVGLVNSVSINNAKRVFNRRVHGNETFRMI
jgi:hypothetical protein